MKVIFNKVIINRIINYKFKNRNIRKIQSFISGIIIMLLKNYCMVFTFKQKSLNGKITQYLRNLDIQKNICLILNKYLLILNNKHNMLLMDTF